MKIAIMPKWPNLDQSYGILFKMLEKNNKVSHLNSNKGVISSLFYKKHISGNFDVLWVNGLRNVSSDKKLVWMPHGNVSFNLQCDKEFFRDCWKELHPNEIMKRLASIFILTVCKRLERKMLKRSDLVICNSNVNMELFFKDHNIPTNERKKYVVIGSGNFI